MFDCPVIGKSSATSGRQAEVVGGKSEGAQRDTRGTKGYYGDSGPNFLGSWKLHMWAGQRKHNRQL